MRQRTYKQIEDSRDRRLWFTQVIIPIASLAVVLYCNTEARENLKRSAGAIKYSISNVVSDLRSRV